MGIEKVRLDRLLAERGLATSLEQAKKLIMAGQVRVGGQVVTESALKIDVDAELTVDTGQRFVSRGGEKLEPALLHFGLDALGGRVCADVGASTGGFTDCLLQHGALKVYAIDVGYGILDWKMRSDPRVVVMERTNARYVHSLPEPVSLVTIDASFISLRVLLPVVKRWLEDQTGEVVALIKPQFEADHAETSKGNGVILDPAVHRAVVVQILESCATEGYRIKGLVRSSIKGPKGNVEFLVHLRVDNEADNQSRVIADLIQEVFG